MDEYIKDFIEDVFKLDEESNYQFKEVCGFTFVFKQTFISFKDRLSSAEIKPIGIIYTQNDEIYYAPLDDNEDTDEIIKRYCR